MDVSNADTVPYMSGQVILSMPSMSCMRCMGFITEAKLGKEAARYGDLGARPQVVWPNGILASSAVGIVVDLVTGWTKQSERKVYMACDGNLGYLYDHERLEFTKDFCEHYRIENTEPAKFRRI